MLVLIIGLTIAIMTDTSIVKISNFTGGLANTIKDKIIFITFIGIFSLSQFLILRYVRAKNLVTIFEKKNIHFLISVTQCILIISLVIITIQIFLLSSYSSMLLKLVVVISYSMAAVFFILLAFRFLIWFKNRKNRLFIAYAVSMFILTLNSVASIAFVLDELSPNRALSAQRGMDMIHYIKNPQIVIAGASNIFSKIQVFSSIFAFVSTWISTVLLLNNYSKKRGVLKYWIIVLLPLLYFLSQFQPLFTELLSSFAESNPVQFAVVYTLVFSASKPIGGLMFGLGLWMMARKVSNEVVKKYLAISAYGLAIFFTSNQPQTLTLIPYPPFGLFTMCFVGLSSYLVLVGIYFSALSVSMDSQVRAQIKKMVQSELEMIGDIGTAQMENQIRSKVVRVAKGMASKMEEEMEVESSLDEADITEYVKSTINEVRKRKSNRLHDTT